MSRLRPKVFLLFVWKCRRHHLIFDIIAASVMMKKREGIAIAVIDTALVDASAH
jgi:hypothetical protein